MKRKKILIFAALCLIFLSFAAGGYLFYRKYTAPKTMREMMEQLYPHVSMSGMSDYAVFDYDGLMNRAHTVALVTPLDDLTKENTFGVSESGDRYYAIHSVREVQVIQYFKNEKNFGETFTMAEKCGLTDVQEIPTESGDIQVTGGLVMEENCYPMQKGNY